MPQTVQSVGKIVHDVTHSWYFRIWGSLWVVCAIVVFAALIVLANQSNTAANEEDLRFWIESATQISYPNFHFRANGNETFVNINCYMMNGPSIQIGACESWRNAPLNKCFSINGETIAASYDPNVHNNQIDTQRIYCNMNTTGNSSGNTLIAWEIEGNETQIGPNSYASIWIAPNNMAWVMIEKSVIGTSTGNEIAWRRTLLYHSTVSVPGVYNTATIIGSFLVSHYVPNDSYNGWMSIGQIGGFAFFLVILHSIVMILMGIFMTNDSKLLNDSLQ